MHGIYPVKGGKSLNIVATNVGQGPVNLLGGGLVYMTEQPDGTNEILFSFSGNRCVLLEATRMHCHEIALDAIDLSDIRVIYLKDTTGRDWTLPKSSLIRLRQEQIS